MELINPFAGFEAISQHKKRSLERRGEDIHVALSTWTRTTNMSAQMCVKNVSPFVHSLDLETVASLPGTLRKISLRPFSIASSDLPRAFARVFSVVSLVKLEVFVIVIVGIKKSLVGIVRPTVRQTRIVEPARLLSALKIHSHSFSISFKFSYPNLF